MRGLVLQKYIPPKEKLFLQKTEFEILVGAMKFDFTLLKNVFDAYMGLRIGELAALQNADVDLERLDVHVSKSISRNTVEKNGVKMLLSRWDQLRLEKFAMSHSPLALLRTSKAD